jgi:hypothetical protein
VRRARWAAVLLAAPLVLGGPAAGARGPDDAPAHAPGQEGIWPARAGQREEHGRTVRGIIVPVDGPVAPLSDAEDSQRAAMTEFMQDRAAFADAFAPGDARYRAEGSGSFIFAPTPGKKATWARAAGEPALRFRFVSGEASTDHAPSPPAAPSGGAPVGPEPRAEPPVITLQRTWFAFYDPSAGKPARGVALVLPGMFGTPVGTMDAIVLRLRREGWAVLRMLSHPSRFTERSRFVIDPAADLEPAAARIAGVLMDRTAECAYAVQAAFGYVALQRPDLAGARRIAVGCSGGAMVLPPVLTLEPERYAASVIIAGGANFWAIIDRSNYAAWINAVRSEWAGGPPTPEARAALDELYLKHAPLDAYHCADALRGRKVLMLQGTADLAVPSAQSDLLWERLGQPERWTWPMGHEMLFMFLPQQFDRLMAWIDEAVAEKP